MSGLAAGVEIAPALWPAAADALGFDAGHGEVRRRDGLTLRAADGWLVLARCAPFDGDPLRDPLGAPGLWRVQQRGDAWTWEHDVPLLRVPPGEARADSPGDAARPLLAALLDWARATACGEAPATDPPSAEDLARWVPPARRSVAAGAHAAPVEIVASSERFALAVPSLVRIPDGLPSSRLAWLRALCLDAQARWRLVRFGFGEDGASVRAEVDLTGTPTPLRCALVRLALAALASSASQALPALALAADPSVASGILDCNPRGAVPRTDERGGTA